MIIRDATLEDADRILQIYAYYVRETAITFEYDVPALKEFRERMHATMERYPYLVAEVDGTVQGFAYAGPFYGRAAYDWCSELSVYLDPNERGHGMGGALYAALERALARMGILNLYACIAVPERDDEYLDHNSAGFHGHLGFTAVGTFRNCGYKFGRWYHVVWMEKIIGPHRPDQPPVRAWREVR